MFARHACSFRSVARFHLRLFRNRASSFQRRLFPERRDVRAVSAYSAQHPGQVLELLRRDGLTERRVMRAAGEPGLTPV
jgi:hypothetical protein